MTGCKWKARLIWVLAEDNKEGAGWSYKVEDPRHNHDRAGKLALPHYQKRDIAALQHIKSAIDNRDSAMKILRSMLSTGATIRRYDIANEMGKNRRADTVAKKQVDLLACSNLLGSNQASKSSQSCAANQASQVHVPCLLDLLGLLG